MQQTRAWFKKVMLHLLQNSRGYSMVELLIAIGVFGVLAPALFAGFIAMQEGKPQQQVRITATALAQEAVEALRIIREQGWETIATNGTYHPVAANDSWSLAVGPETANGFIRSIVIEDAFRSGAGALAQAGTIDLSTKKITISVSWDQPLTTSTSTVLYMTRYLDNLAFTHTTTGDFSASGSTFTSTEVAEQGDGAVILAPFGPGGSDWCEPSIVAQADLPKNGEARSLSASYGSIFAATGANSSGDALSHISITDTNPPVPTITGAFDGYKVNDVFNIYGHAFLATDSQSKEVVIVNTSTMQEVGHFNGFALLTGDGVFVKDSVGYVVEGQFLQLFDLSSLSGSRPSYDYIWLQGFGTSVYVVGNYAYVTRNNTSSQLRIYNISNPNNISLVGSLTVDGREGRDVYVSPDGNRAYMVTAQAGSDREFWLINTSNKSSPSVISSYDTNGMDPRAVDMVLDGNRAIIVGSGTGQEYQVVSIALESAPTLCGGLNDDNGYSDVDTVIEADGDVYAYVTSHDAVNELKIIAGGPGNGYSESGTYESPPFDAGSPTAFNRLSFSHVTPSDTTLQLQVAGTPQVGGSCSGATYSFVGPDGTSNTYFDDPVNGLPFSSDGIGYENPAQCFKYKAFFETSDIEVTPILEEVTINYSP